MDRESEDIQSWDMFDEFLSVAVEDIEFEFTGFTHVPWADYFLNPRRLRGSDFLMRWNQGVWSERIVIEAVNETREFYAISYGPSSVAPDNDVHAYELYFERLEQAGLSQLKRPDILIFKKSDAASVDRLVSTLGGEQELPFIPEEDAAMRELLSDAVIAVECENSLWRAGQMPAYGEQLRSMRRLGGKLGLPKNAVFAHCHIERGRPWKTVRMAGQEQNRYPHLARILRYVIWTCAERRRRPDCGRSNRTHESEISGSGRSHD